MFFPGFGPDKPVSTTPANFPVRLLVPLKDLNSLDSMSVNES